MAFRFISVAGIVVVSYWAWAHFKRQLTETDVH
jgi:hypothetical protein